MSVATASLAHFEPISLEETNRIARLQERVDRKYVISLDLFGALADELAAGYAALEVMGRQLLQYDTAYFDTDDLLCYRSHLQGRRRRFKVRSRRYCDSGLCVFELKYKDARGRTIKERIDYPWRSHGEFDAAARTFVASTLRLRYGIGVPSPLSRTLEVAFSRLTLVSRLGGDRITFDFGLLFRTADARETRLGLDYVLVETKGGSRPSLADELLRRHGQRPLGCSKYCVGLGSTDPRVKNNPLRPVLRRYFDLYDDHRPDEEAQP